MLFGPDQYLADALRHLQRTWWRPEVGIVVAGIIAEGHVPVFATSTSAGPGRWYHAERNALTAFERQYGAPDPRSLIVSSLSPCLRPSQSREGECCTELLLDHGLTTVHAGIIDPEQTSEGSRVYAKHGLGVTLTLDPGLGQVCRLLLNLFREYGSRINYDLMNIKANLGDEFATRLVTN